MYEKEHLFIFSYKRTIHFLAISDKEADFFFLFVFFKVIWYLTVLKIQGLYGFYQKATT